MAGMFCMDCFYMLASKRKRDYTEKNPVSQHVFMYWLIYYFFNSSLFCHWYFRRRSLLINELLFPSSWDQQPAEPQIMYMLSKENPGISAALKSAAYSDWVNAAETTSFMTLILKKPSIWWGLFTQFSKVRTASGVSSGYYWLFFLASTGLRPVEGKGQLKT